MQKYLNSAADSITGASIAGATVTVYEAGTTSLASLYSDNGVTPTSNPQTTDAQGAYSFYAPDGRYDIVIAKSGFASATLTDVEITDSMDQISVASGSAALPALTSASDTTSGIYFPAPGQVGISTAGVSKAIVDSTGKLTWTVFPSATGYAASWGASHDSLQKVACINTNAGASAKAVVAAESDAGFARIAVSSVAGGASGSLESNASGGIFVGASHATGLLSLVAYGATRATMTNAKFDLVAGMAYRINDVQVMQARITGWGAPTGTATRTSFATGSVTLPNLAQAVKALIDDLTTHGLIGP